MNKKFLSTKELGSLLGVTRQTVRNWIKKGEIKAFHIGQNLKIPVEEALRVILHYELPVPDWLKDGFSFFKAFRQKQVQKKAALVATKVCQKRTGF